MSAQNALNKRQFPVTETVPMYHGTTEERAAKIEAEGFTGSTVHLTPHADLAASYAAGRVLKDKGGKPAVLRTDPVRGVSASETAYGSADLNRSAGADYMDKGPEVVVLNPRIISGIKRI